MRINDTNIELKCENCVFYDYGTCVKFNDNVDSDYVCDDYEQDEEPEPHRIRCSRRKHKNSENEE